MAIMGVTSSASVIVQSLAGMRAKLDDLQRQLSTGEKSDTYAGLGPQRALTVGLQAQLDAAQGFDDTITRVGTRLSIAQNSLTAIGQSAQSVKQSLVQPSFILSANGQTVDQQTAQGQLDTMLAALNAQDGTGYIFSGLNANTPAVDTLDHIMNGNGSAAGFKQVMSERRQADVGSNGLGRLVIPAPGAASIVGSTAALNPDAPAAVTGSTNISALLSAGGNLVINGTTITINPSDNAAAVVNAINAQSGATGVTATIDGSNHLVLTSADADTAINVGGATSAGLLAELGVAATTTNSMNLLTQAAVTAGQTLTVTVGANPALTVVFGNGPGQVSTLAELTSALLGLSGGAASVDPANGNISVTALNNADSVTIGGTATVANFGLTTVPATPTAGATSVSLSEDAAGSPFGFKLAGASSTLSGAVVTGPTGNPPRIAVNLAANPGAGQALTLTFTLPDGTTENLTLTATTSSPPGANQFIIGANAAATATNLQSAMSAAVTKLADTSLVAASAIAAANNFFDTDAATPPQRVSGPPFGTATSLTAGTAANTVSWYTGEAGASSARTTALARVDPAIAISYGMRANEVGLRSAVKNVAVYAAMSFSPTNPDTPAQYGALTARLAVNFSPPQGIQSITDISAEIANAQIMANDAKDRHKQSTATLTDFLQSIENVPPEQVGTELLALQTTLQASLQTTAMLSKLSLVNYL
jgi:hypothetical protein